MVGLVSHLSSQRKVPLLLWTYLIKCYGLGVLHPKCLGAEVFWIWNFIFLGGNLEHFNIYIYIYNEIS
jgi:hypothetical protein